LYKTKEAVQSCATANRLGAFRFGLVLAMIASYLAMMAFLINNARQATQVTVVTSDFSPAMIAVASCMTFSVILTGLFVFVQRRD
jgi:uncharacterized membrane protein YozB (DUF420 family)